MKMEIEINSAATAPSSTLDDDETLMQRVQSGDDHAFEVLIEPGVAALALRSSPRVGPRC